MSTHHAPTTPRLAPLLDTWAQGADVRRLLAAVGRAGTVDVSASEGARPFVIAALAGASASSGPVVVVTATTREADDLAAALTGLLPADRIGVFPSWETLPHERLSPRSDTVGRRLAVLRRIAHPDPDDAAYGPLSVVVAPVRAILQPISTGLAELVPVALKAGDERPLDEVVDALVAAAYTRTDLVERRGEFAVRGGILDVFPPTEEHPVRVEWWGDTVEEVRAFKVADQRSLGISPETGGKGLLEHGLWAPPCRELLLTPDVRHRARALAESHPELAEICVKIADGHPVEGMEALAPVLVD
ncbi:MAG TPA: transcription-repair coupling factor, partial [Intrasporangium sp.]|nr:transcription-repair coupling factor [Intrasporangium sp.]